MSLCTLIEIKDTHGNWSNLFDGSIRAETYKIIPNARQDVDSYRDANGLLHRNTVEHSATTIQFNLKTMWQKDMQRIMSALYGMAQKPEMKYQIRYFNPLTGGKSEGEFYLGANHPVWEIYGTYGHNKLGHAEDDAILYKETEFKFIEY